MKFIPLTQGKFAMVDDADYDNLMQFSWQAQKRKHTWYAVRAGRLPNGEKTMFYMHRQILGLTDPKIQGEHQDRNGLNNQKANIRAATHAQNQKNKGKPLNNTTGYKGLAVEPNGRYRVQCSQNGNSHYLGTFDCPHEAARHYNLFAKSIGEGFECLNDVEPMFPTEPRLTQADTKFKVDGQALPSGIDFKKKNGKFRVRTKDVYVGIYATLPQAIAALEAHKK